MAFKARLNFSGKEHDVLNCPYTLNRDLDSTKFPWSGVSEHEDDQCKIRHK